MIIQICIPARGLKPLCLSWGFFCLGEGVRDCTTDTVVSGGTRQTCPVLLSPGWAGLGWAAGTGLGLAGAAVPVERQRRSPSRMLYGGWWWLWGHTRCLFLLAECGGFVA